MYVYIGGKELEGNDAEGKRWLGMGLWPVRNQALWEHAK